MKQSVLLAFALIFNLAAALGQSNAADSTTQNDRLVATARWHQNRVEIRWAPSDFSTWQRANQRGYLVERIGEDNRPVLLTAQPLRPLPMMDWVTKTDTSNRWNKAAAQLLYGKMPDLPAAGGLGSMKELAEFQAFCHAQALIAADLSEETSRGLALRFVDKSAPSGQGYLYRISIADSLGRLPVFSKMMVGKEVAYASVSTKNDWNQPGLTGLTAISGEHLVRLVWPKLGNANSFTAFNADKSSDGGTSWKRLNDVPIFTSGHAENGNPNTFLDSLSENYRPALYRVIGLTAWGDSGLPSEPVSAMGRDFTPPGGAENIHATSLAANKIQVKWTAKVNPADLAGWFVERGNDAKGVFEKINSTPLPPASRLFFDTEPFAFETNFYRVVAVDTAGNEGHSFSILCHIVDSIPPAKPLGLVGKIDTNGLVAIAWDANSEPDLRGYRVYFSHAIENREFNQVTTEPVFENFFLDTIPIRVLNESIFYRVVAVDYRWNHSEYSDWLPLEKPDVVPPVAPVFKTWSTENGAVKLTWANSPSRDVARQILWRKTGDDGPWEMHREFTKPFQTAFLEKNAGDKNGSQNGDEFTFALEAIDDDGLASGKSNPLTISILPTENRPGVDGLTAVFDEKTGTARLAWQFTDGQKGADERRFVILRAAENEPELSTWKSVGGDELAFAEPLRSSGKVRYAVKAIFADGGESAVSKTVEIGR